jgi:hypothetical protein
MMPGQALLLTYTPRPGVADQSGSYLMLECEAVAWLGSPA